MKIRNLTPHQITILDGPSFRSERGEQSPRVEEELSPLGQLGDVPLSQRTLGKVRGLPASVPGDVLIVSALVAEAAPERSDLVFPGSLVRDAGGRITGCRVLVAGPGMLEKLHLGTLLRTEAKVRADQEK